MNWKQILRSLKSRDMQKRLLVVLGIIVVYRFLAHVPVPLAQPEQLQDVIQSVISSSNFGGFLNLLSGGALSAISIMLVGLAPFITASIVMQLLTKAIPRLEELHKDGESGRRKISQWTRLLTLPLAIVQSIAFIFILRQTTLAANSSIDISGTDPLQWIIMVGSLTAGAMLLMWLGELITEQGVGNGMSLLIFAGIISQLPSLLQTIITSLTQNVADAEKLNIFGWVLPINGFLFWVILAVIALALAVLYILVKINEAQRIVTINYAKRVQGNRTYGGVQSILPIKLITAGVIPVIFAVAFLALPAFLGQLLQMSDNPTWAGLGANLISWFQAPQVSGSVASVSDLAALIYPLSYFVLVVFFTYFYTNIVFNSAEIAENLQKQGGFIANVRPGKQTQKYLSQLVNRVTLFGAFALGMIAILPFAMQYVFAGFGLNAQSLAIGGTGLLIVVSVTLETLRQINSRALMVTYDQDY